jgi:hypothetical protein
MKKFGYPASTYAMSATQHDPIATDVVFESERFDPIHNSHGVSLTATALPILIGAQRDSVNSRGFLF